MNWTLRLIESRSQPSSSRSRPVCYREDRVRQPLPERGIVAELLEQLRMIGQEICHDALERFVVLDARVLAVGMFHGVLIRFIRRHLRGNLFADHCLDLVAVLPIDIAELIIERLDDVAESIEFGFRLSTATARRDGTDFGILVRKCNADGRLHLGPGNLTPLL